ncbi:hypothetical protein HK101_003679 [Irineochytrium annulatum]|nr:hypothetical protein HK101_003679 [Irineochytrium annulatum]
MQGVMSASYTYGIDESEVVSVSLNDLGVKLEKGASYDKSDKSTMLSTVLPERTSSKLALPERTSSKHAHATPHGGMAKKISSDRVIRVQTDQTVGGVLSYGKWNSLSNSEINFEEAQREGRGHVEDTIAGRKFILNIESMDKQEIKRQEVIFELILTEKE